MQEKLELSMERTDENRASLKELIFTIKDWLGYLLSKWYIIVLFGLIGAVLGFAYAHSKKTVYTAITSFVLETGGRGGGLGAYAGIASSLGIDLSGGGGGLFEGENILELYSSRNMISKTLLTKGDFQGRSMALIDRYIEFNNLRHEWDNDVNLKAIKFNEFGKYSSSGQQIRHDSIMKYIVEDIRKNYLKVEKKDRKLNIVTVTVTSPDELFAKVLNENLVENVNQFYLDTKTKKSLVNVAILQAKTDSVQNKMSGSIGKAAAVADATPNQNPTRMAQRIAPIQNARVSAEISQSVLGVLLQNLELSKINLLKETPLIQIVDEPLLPLDRNGYAKSRGVLIGGILGGIIVIIFLILRRLVLQAVR